MTNENDSSKFWAADRIGLSMEESSKTDLESGHDTTCLRAEESSAIVCPVCGAVAVHEKCKVICRSETCRGRVIMNCAEF